MSCAEGDAIILPTSCKGANRAELYDTFLYLLVIKGISQVHLFCISTIILTGTKQTDTKTMGKICEMHFDRMQDMITLNNCASEVLCGKFKLCHTGKMTAQIYFIFPRNEKL